MAKNQKPTNPVGLGPTGGGAFIGGGASIGEFTVNWTSIA